MNARAYRGPILTAAYWFSFVLTILPGPSYAHAQVEGSPREKIVLHNAGFAFGGTDNSSKIAFPNTRRLLDDRSPNGTTILEAELNQKLAAARLGNITITPAQGSIQNGDDVAIAFVLNRENFSKEQLGPEWKIVADLYGEAMIFDFGSKKIIAAYPFGVQFRDVRSEAPTPEYALSVFRDLYLGDKLNVFDSFIRALRNADIKRSYGAYAQITDVNLEGLATRQIETFGATIDEVKEFVAESFGSALFEQDRIPLVPYITGVAIGHTMVARFPNGNVYNLKLPEPDFEIRLTIRGFKKVDVSETQHEIAYAFASFAKIKILQGLSDRPYLDTGVKFAVTKTVPKEIGAIDDWSAYQESLLSLFNGLARQFASPDDHWIAAWTQKKDVAQEFKRAGQALARTR